MIKSNENPCPQESRWEVKEKSHCWISEQLSNTPGWKMWCHQQWRQSSKPQGGLLHGMKHDSQKDSVILENQACDNSCALGPQPRTPAQFDKRVFHGLLLTGSSCTMRQWAQIRPNTETTICVHNVHVHFSLKPSKTLKRRKLWHRLPFSSSYVSSVITHSADTRSIWGI